MSMTKAQSLLVEYKNKLDNFFATHHEANTLLSQQLEEDFSPEKLKEFLIALIEDKKTLAQVAARSYQHGNGFFKVVLLNHGYKLRLHVWFAGQSCEENIHDHRWSFSSLILAGELKSEIWQDDRLGQQFQEFEYHAASNAYAPTKKFIGQNHLSLLQTNVNCTGQSYVMPKGKLHRIINPGHQMVATMMCSAPTEQGTTRLIPMHQGIDPNIQPPKAQVYELEHALTQFLNHLSK